MAFTNIREHWHLSVLLAVSFIPIILVFTGTASLNEVGQAASFEEAMFFLEDGITRLYWALGILAVICLLLANAVRDLAIKVRRLENEEGSL